MRQAVSCTPRSLRPVRDVVRFPGHHAFTHRKQSHDTAQLFGLSDRGVIEVGKKADINVIPLPRVLIDPGNAARVSGGRADHSFGEDS